MASSRSTCATPPTLNLRSVISNIATPSWTSLRPRRGIRLEVLAFVGLLFAALLVEPWWTLSAICAGYLLLLPYSLLRYARFKRRG